MKTHQGTACDEQEAMNEHAATTTPEKSKWTLCSAKSASLVALVLQQAGLVLLIRHSRIRNDVTADAARPYITSTAVVSAEFIKLILNFSLEFIVAKPETMKSVWKDLTSAEALKLIVPAFLYLIQNNLLFVALSNLPVPVYQLTNQGKLLTTAICSRILLDKSISAWQYVSLAILAVGVALVQLSSIEEKATQATGNEWLGLTAVIISCFTSGFAGVYFEKILKSKNSEKSITVYMRNCHLSIWSIILGFVPVYTKDFEAIRAFGFFQGYNFVVMAIIVGQAMTGLIVAFVMKYADTILKGFATSVAFVLATVLSIFIWKARVDNTFVVGAAMVMGAVWLYSTNQSGNLRLPSFITSINNSTTKEEGKSSCRKSAKVRRTIAVVLGVQLILQVYGNSNFRKNVSVGFSTPGLSQSAELKEQVVELKSQVAALANSRGEVAVTSNLSVEANSVVVEASSNNTDCPLRQIPQVARNWTWDTNKRESAKPMLYAPCVRFECNKNLTKCANMEPTNYDGDTPPCCVHILRDMAAAFDALMCELGLEYFASYGMLLGLHRSDQLIPWTIDNDYIATRSTIQYLMTTKKERPEVFEKHGLHFLLDNFFRICPAKTFGGGKLAEKWTNPSSKGWYPLFHQYADIFVSDVDRTGKYMRDELRCSLKLEDFRPVRRTKTYNGTLALSFPSNPERILAHIYGENWRTPDAKKSEHGNTHCRETPGVEW